MSTSGYGLLRPAACLTKVSLVESRVRLGLFSASSATVYSLLADTLFQKMKLVYWLVSYVGARFIMTNDEKVPSRVSL